MLNGMSWRHDSNGYSDICDHSRRVTLNMATTKPVVEITFQRWEMAPRFKQLPLHLQPCRIRWHCRHFNVDLLQEFKMVIITWPPSWISVVGRRCQKSTESQLGLTWPKYLNVRRHLQLFLWLYDFIYDFIYKLTISPTTMPTTFRRHPLHYLRFCVVMYDFATSFTALPTPLRHDLRHCDFTYDLTYDVFISPMTIPVTLRL